MFSVERVRTLCYRSASYRDNNCGAQIEHLFYFIYTKLI